MGAGLVLALALQANISVSNLMEQLQEASGGSVAMGWFGRTWGGGKQVMQLHSGSVAGVGWLARMVDLPGTSYSSPSLRVSVDRKGWVFLVC